MVCPARSNIVTALQNELGAKLKAAIKLLDEESLAEEKARLQQTQALYNAVSVMVLIHTYLNPNFPSHFFPKSKATSITRWAAR